MDCMRIMLLVPPVRNRPRPDPEGWPFGPLSLAGQLDERHDVALLDGYSRGLSLNQVLDSIMRFQPELLAVSIMFSNQMPRAREILTYMSSRQKNAHVCLGGVYPTFNTAQCLELDGVDYVFRGEADGVFPEFVERLEAGDNPAGLAGLCTEPSEETPIRIEEDLDALEPPRHSLVHDASFYSPKILCGRGCAVGCIYCVAAAYCKGRVRRRSIVSVLTDVSRMVNAGRTKFSFADDNLWHEPEYVRDLCREIERHCPTARWGASMHPSPGLLQFLPKAYAAGLRALFLGVESANPQTLEKLRRGYSPEEIKQLVSTAEDLGIAVTGSFILGFPWENRSDTMNTIEFAASLGASRVDFHVLTPFRGTPLYRLREKLGIRLTGEPEENLDLDRVVGIETPHLTADELEELFLLARKRVRNEAAPDGAHGTTCD